MMAASLCQKQCLFALFILAFWINQVIPRQLQQSLLAMSKRHEQWMAKHGKVYEDAEEHQKRFRIFKENVEFIESFNAAGDRSYNLSINQFADLTREEFKKLYLGYKPSHQTGSRNVTSFKYESMIGVPDSVDWRARGAVTSVKSQGSCGGCWAFSAVAAVESMHLINKHVPLDLSEQQLLDCDPLSHGCGGGLMRDAFEYIIANGGITSEKNYPFVEHTQYPCNKASAGYTEVKLSGYQNVPIYSEESLMRAVAKQPVSVAIEASTDNFRFYRDGIFKKDCGSVLNHAVLAVGYGTSPDGIKYWILKNSWAKSWGEGGYMRLARGVAGNVGICGITSDSSFPIA
ncbi:hypothetical protein GH714_031304 [Hevea brasiliensis]|uniref:Cysteine proteinase n=1 Tax=Hevea brasiliensis TaxID=3981 RepID=A0A6A6L4I8_HEVBR|nr:hypothetical protein GH714_031304 [Hevea brasiliensis]